MKTLSRPPRRRWLLAHTLGIGFSLSHLILDWWAGLIVPPTESMTGYESFILLVILALCAGLYALWANALAQASLGSRRAMVATILVAAVASLNGFSIVFCLPPCAFPVGDLSHIGSLIFCLWAIFESGRALKQGSNALTTYAGEGVA